MSTRAELRMQIAERADDPTHAVAKESLVNAWLNLAIRAAWNRWPWSFATDQVNLTAGEMVDLPAAVSRPKLITILDPPWRLRPGNLRLLRNRDPSPSPGLPTHYLDGGLTQPDPLVAPSRRLMLDPPPDKDYDLSVFYIRAAPQMTDDRHAFPMPLDFIEAVIVWSLARYYRKLEDLQQAKEHAQAFEEELHNLASEFGVFHVDGFPILETEEGW